MVLPAKNLLVDEQRRSAATAWLSAELPHVPRKTRLEVYVKKKGMHEIASDHKNLGEALQEHEEDYPYRLEDHRKRQLQGIAKATHLNLMTTVKKDEVEHRLRMINSDIVVAEAGEG